MPRQPTIDHDLVRKLYEEIGNASEVHRELARRGINCVYPTVRLILFGRKKPGNDRKTKTRFVPADIADRIVRLPRLDNESVSKGRTLYPHTVVRDLEGHTLLKDGFNIAKIGNRVHKGKWRGMPIYTLTLEERATCPTSCGHWRSCYGNALHFSYRASHEAPDFKMKLVREVAALSRKHRDGFVIRLHILGDFFSVQYVNLWAAMIDTIPNLRVFGYSARNDDDIGVALRSLVAKHWDRFAIRFSDARDAVPATVSIEHPIQKPADTVICPEQWTPSGKRAESCGTCTFCWTSPKRVAFITH
jgi:hypothetical protein